MRKFLDQAAFHDAARSGRSDEAAVLRIADGDPAPIAGTRRVRFCFSDGSVDRMGDTIDPNGWSLGAFNRNPCALWAHDSSAPPIGRASDLAVESGKLMGTIEFASATTYEFADTIFRLVKDGFVSAVSVGFIPLKYQFSSDKRRPNGIDFLEQELIEISVCPVPANSNALLEGRGFTRAGAAGRHARAMALQRVLSAPYRHGGDDRSEVELLANARSLALREIHAAADLATAAGRAVHAKRLRRHYAVEGGASVVSRAAVFAEAAWRTAPRW